MTDLVATPAVRRKPVFHELAVAHVERLTEDSVAVTFAVPSELAEAYAFEAGQHLNIRTSLAGDDVRRSYSICSPEGGPLRVGVKVLPGGAFSSYVHATLAPGDVLEVMTPLGRFKTPLDPTNAKRYCFIAAGSGITPVMSLMSTILAVEPNSEVVLLYGNRTTASVMFLEELEGLKDRYLERVQLVHVLSREEQESPLLTGRLDADKLTKLLGVLVPPASVDEWFLCGPFGLVESARAVLADAGADERHVHFELFHAEPLAPSTAVVVEAAGEGAEVTAVLDGRKTAFTLPPSKSVLDGLLAVRADAPYACKGGVCGTCRAQVVDGSVRMDTNYALEADEVERGFVLTCQSHPTSDKVTLDYDA
ncbi:MAG: ring,2-phenylacetyl-CoA epoxidase subunit PaaE [Frankiales bacterium]|nr:ring,2-phenylacetyl-CoA epoxidase subunit PaaE [Frankiales bacterium]